MTFALRGRLSLDARDWRRGIKQAEAGVDDLSDSLEDVPDAARTAADGTERELGKIEGAGSRIGDLAGGKLGKGLIAGFAAAGVATFVKDQLDAAFDRQDSLNTLAGQMGITAEQAGEFGKLAGDLYTDGFGSSVEQLATIAAQANRKLGATTESELKSITTNVAAVAKTWDEDFNAVIRSTSQLVDNGLAPSAEAALDLIVAGMQNGANEAGDLLDTIDEYSQHWHAAGLSGEQAMNMMVAGIQAGQRDVDKIGDAVKEMRLRIVENSEQVRDALQDIGLDADEIVDAFLAGGPAAEEAYRTVVRALKRGQDAGDDTANAVAIIGTQFEDMGPKALDILGQVEGALGDTEGAAAKLADTVQETPWEQTKREGQEALSKITNAAIRGSGLNRALEDTNDLLDDLTNGFGLWGDSGSADTDDVTAAVSGLGAGLARAARDAKGAQRPNRTLADIIADVRDEALAAADAVGEEWGPQIVDATGAAKEHADAVAAQEEAIQQFNSAVIASLGGVFSYEEQTLRLASASRSYAEDVAALTAEYEAGKITADEYAVGLEGLRLQEIANAEQALRAAEAFADQQGAVEGSTNQARLMKEELQRLAGQYPHLSDEIARYIEELGRIPALVSTELRVTGSGLRVLTGGTRPADPRNGIAALASGTRHHTGGLALVGERGPELVNLPQGSQVFTADQTRAMMTPTSAGGSMSMPAPSVRVYIGDRELTDIVDVVVDDRDAEAAAQYRAGRLN